MSDPLDLEITRDLGQSRYEARVVTAHEAAVVGVLRYERHGDVVQVTSTVVLPAHRHRGVASALVRRALDDVRAEGLRVEPRCWYVSEWIADHPQYADLRWQAPPSGATMDR
ncbi:GNAT family N-acetyltransferase [Isoptericola aurantiacus]|uniref:GNAT family N-acetyltransferase n=1 Tax=Isoptericola aurantiacus TaxID=3377839 RepID=UPI00383B6A1F